MKLLERVRDVALRRHLARTTFHCYQLWIADFLRFSRDEGRWREPTELGATEVGAGLKKLTKVYVCLPRLTGVRNEASAGGNPNDQVPMTNQCPNDLMANRPFWFTAVYRR